MGMKAVGFDLDALRAAVAQHAKVIRIVITGFDGSSPRETGASMLVWANGQSGTIGGGALEFEATRIAHEMLAESGGWARNSRTITLGPALGQCCGGAVSILAECYSEFELADIGADRAFARQLTSGAPDADSARIFSEYPIAQATPVWIYGAGHVGRALVHALHGLPYRITWVDTDIARFPKGIPAHADALVAQSPADAVRHAPQDAMHFVMTYSHAFDLEICHRVLVHGAGFLGLIGSDTKRARFHSRLRKLGHSDATIDRLNCPIGDPTLGKTPAAIALGVVHGLLKSMEEKGLHRKEGSAA